MVMSQAHMPEPINWERVIEEEPVPDLEGPPREQGTQLHEWLRNRDELDYLDFERELSWSGRYDCNDGTYLYEFKTVGEIPGGPRTQDRGQLVDYLDDTGFRFGFLVYVDRETLEVEQYEVDARR